MEIYIPSPVNHILKVLNANGHEAFIVGGCVRDSLMGRVPYDWDIATSALPAEIKSCFPRTHDTGIEHGTVTVVYKGANYEVTTYRVDGEYKDGRRPESVSFTANLREDLARRDFTINAMAWRPGEGLTDPFGGMDDIKSGVIRCVGDPDLRFGEDALRMMRAVRFAGVLDFDIGMETFSSIKRNAAGLKRISAERVRDELTKLLLSPHPEKITLLWESGLLPEGWPLPMKPTEGEVYGSVKYLTACPKKTALAYAALFFNREPENALQAMNALRFDNSTCRDVYRLIKWAKYPVPNQDYAVRKFLSLSGRAYFHDIMTMKELMGTSDCDILPLLAERYEKITEGGDCLDIGGLRINGDDLLAMGFSGKQIGDTLNRLLDMILREPSLNNKETLKRLADVSTCNF